LIQDRGQVFQKMALRPVEEVVGRVLERADVAMEVKEAVTVVSALEQGEVVGDVATAGGFVLEVALWSLE